MQLDGVAFSRMKFTIMGLHFSVLKELLKWGRKFSFRYQQEF